MLLTPHSIDWTNATSHLFLNPRLPKNSAEIITNAFQKINEKNHIFLTTSGSTAKPNTYKLVALHKNAFLESSHAVNAMFEIGRNDVLLNILPIFHVGGLSLFSRAFCAQAEMVNIWDENFKWDPHEFVNICHNKNVTVTSLVPTHVHDIVMNHLKSPFKLRCVFVGGGALSDELLLKANDLGWNLYPTYGMTECCSQVATAVSFRGLTAGSTSFPLRVLSHLTVTINDESRIVISGSSLLSYYVFISGNDFSIQDPKINNSFETQDVGQFQNGHLHVLGRIDDNVKINGEFTNIIHLNHVLKLCLTEYKMDLDCTITAVPNARKGVQLVAVFVSENENSKEKINEVLIHFNTRVMPYERIEKITFVEQIPRTDLGKVKTGVLHDKLDIILS